jgi:CRISPR/Cas system-associated exonuclease Cas4 (RecB family)
MSDANRSPIQLNQSNLQDFLECPRRFELRNIHEASWPAVLSEPPTRFEELTELGDRFHKLSNQFFIGIDPTAIESSIHQPELKEMWGRFIPYAESLADHKPFTEQILRTTLNGYILIAKYDYVACLPDRSFLIVDWKTSTKKPDRSTLAARVQTYLYPYIFYESYRDLFDMHQLLPKQISLQYWYPNSPEPEEIFPYSEERHQRIKEQLSSIISRIDSLQNSEMSFPLTEDLKLCQFCNFRSLCERAASAGSLALDADYENEDLSNTHFDLDLINEMEF